MISSLCSDSLLIQTQQLKCHCEERDSSPVIASPYRVGGEAISCFVDVLS